MAEIERIGQRRRWRREGASSLTLVLLVVLASASAIPFSPSSMVQSDMFAQLQRGIDDFNLNRKPPEKKQVCVNGYRTNIEAIFKQLLAQKESDFVG